MMASEGKAVMDEPHLAEADALLSSLGSDISGIDDKKAEGS